jgi:hypothetical protein
MRALAKRLQVDEDGLANEGGRGWHNIGLFSVVNCQF